MNEINICKANDNYPYDLLLLADETKEAIDKYLFCSDVYVAKLFGSGDPIGVFCLYHINADTIEIKNIAVSEQYQGTGIRSCLLAKSCKVAREQGYKEIIVGTGDAGIKQIHFYEKSGFVKYGIKKDFFLSNYDKPIYENGIMLKDMVMLKRYLKE
ncbi:MAG: GNAT family N-acetyltransferase, partial [Tannerellaceae bacterium]|nr:GNAT family N-acetyltransferase [Tannerellaceae bacterium]